MSTSSHHCRRCGTAPIASLREWLVVRWTMLDQSAQRSASDSYNTIYIMLFYDGHFEMLFHLSVATTDIISTRMPDRLLLSHARCHRFFAIVVCVLPSVLSSVTCGPSAKAAILIYNKGLLASRRSLEDARPKPTKDREGGVRSPQERASAKYGTHAGCGPDHASTTV